MTFQGDKKVGRSILANAEDRLKKWLLPKVPARIETYHLTLSTILWSLLVIVFGFLASFNIRWLWLASLTIALQYVTDLLDGAIGRTRNTGLVKWGYYMDHFLDYVFLCSLLIGYSLLLPDNFKYILFFILALFGCFMVNSFLSFATSNEFKISYLGIGPTEIRILFIAVNTLLIVFGKTYLAKALPLVMILSAFGLFVTVYKTQREIWTMDMKEKAGSSPASSEEGGISAELLREFSDGLSMRKIARNIGFSLALALVALIVWMTKLLHPYHRMLAAGLYLLSWAPFLLSFRQKRAFLREHAPKLRRAVLPYLIHVIVAVTLLALGYSAWVLAPVTETPLIALGDEELRRDIAEDMDSVYILRWNVERQFDWISRTPLAPPDARLLSSEAKEQVRDVWAQLLTTFLELEMLKDKYAGFYQIDHVARPSVHANAFFAGYAAFITQYKMSLFLAGMVKENDVLKTALNEASPARGIPAHAFSAMLEGLTHPRALLRLNAGAAYYHLVKKAIDARRDLLLPVEADMENVYRALGRQSRMLITNPLEIFDRRAFDVWFPFQKTVAKNMSLLRVIKRENFVKRDMLLEYRKRLLPGDLLLERRNWFMSNIGIPGFWPHVAMYVGTAEELDAYFDDLPELEGMPASEFLRRRCPKASKVLRLPDEKGRVRNVIEALREGVVLTSLMKSGHADYLAAIRPRVSRIGRFKAIINAFDHFGKPYDYNFDFATDNSLVCSELVFKSYQGIEGIDFKLELINGRLILPPNLIVKKFAEEFGGENQKLDFIFFLDGSETTQHAQPRDAEALRASWKRPKWDVLQK